MERMKKLTESDSGDMTSEEMLQQFENVENQSAESEPHPPLHCLEKSEMIIIFFKRVFTST